MLQILTPEQSRRLDAHMIGEQGIPGIVLMEHAALGIVEAVLRLLKPQGRVCILCGGGNNGGDGMAVLRQLFMRGVSASAVLLAGPEQLTGDALTQYRMAAGCGLPITLALTDEAVEALHFSDADVLVDALFGTGLSRAVQGRYLRAIERINDSGKPVVAVDIPSGVDGATGHVLGAAVQAAVTVTFQNKKLGHLLFPGRGYAGEVRVVPIGLPALPLEAALELEESDVCALLPERPSDSHKGKNGHALLCAGSGQYAGAALLAAKSALRSGCGLLYAAVPRGIRAVFAGCPGAICHPVGYSEEWQDAAAQEAIALLPKVQAAAIGPGMGAGGGISILLEAALNTGKPLIIDADGLNALAANPKLMRLLHKNVLLTPHPGEMGRLTNKSVPEILDDPVRVARQAAEAWGCVVLLKGATSVIAQGDRVCLNATGNPGLAKGGSGDVLTGILLALFAQGLAHFEAASAGAYLLGCAAEKAYALLGTRMLLPTDVIDALGN